MQIVGYVGGSTGDTDGPEPALLLADHSPSGQAADHPATPTADHPTTGQAADLERVPLAPGTDLSYRLGDRRCAGVIDGDRHHSCDRPRAPYCETHTETWVCARCTGTCLKDEMDCYDDHAVYLAAFAPDTFKVGVTRLNRLDRRLREQGADRAAHVRTVENGRIAREIEASLAETIPDRVRVPTKIEGLHRQVDEALWADLLGDFSVIDRFSFDYGFELSYRPVATTIASGTVRGVQGRVLVTEKGSTTYAVDMRELVGHEVTAGEASDRQSSLGAFG